MEQNNQHSAQELNVPMILENMTQNSFSEFNEIENSARSSKRFKGNDEEVKLPQTSDDAGRNEQYTCVLESKKVCYCSNFDLNINDWYAEFEHIRSLKSRMVDNLGKSIDAKSSRKTVGFIL